MAKKESVKNEAGKQEIVVAQTTAVTVAPEVPETAWGSENISGQDLVIPKLLVMQGMSKAVSDGLAAVGDIVDSLTMKKVGNRKEPVSFIPFYTYKTWIESRKKGEKFEYVRQVPMDATNEDLPVEYKDGETIMRRDRCINVYVLLSRDLKSDEAVMPYMISFRRTSYQAGKVLSTLIKKLAEFNKPAASKTFSLNVADKENEKGKFCILGVGEEGVTPNASMAIAYRWYKTVLKGVKVDDSDLVSEVVPAARSASQESSDDISY